MKAALIVIGVLIVLALVCGAKFIGIRNQLVTEREAIDAQWRQVDVVLQRRSDLIPNLVETVKGYAKHEQGVINEVAERRRIGSRPATGWTRRSRDCWSWWRTIRI